MSADRVGKLTSIGKYRIIRELGRGGMGVVYLAEDTRLQRQVALKILHPFLSMDEEFVRRFTSEAQAIAALSHRGIVRVHAFEEVDGSLLIDMEYIEGGSLDQLLADGPRSASQAMGIALRVFEALAACHAQGIVHRDIKPSNILMANDGRVLLTDFGLARSCALASASTATSSSFIGTPKYAAPESWGRATPTPAGDVYSAGLVLLELLAGKTPFDGDSPLEIMRKTLLATPVAVRELLPDGSNELIALLEELLVADPARRPANAGQALQCLQAIPEYAKLPDDNSDTIRVTPILLRGKATPRSGRRTARIAVASLLLAFFLGLAWILRPVPESARDGAAHNSNPPTVPNTPVVPVQAVAPDPAYLTGVGNHVVFVANAGPWRSLWSYDTTSGQATPLWPELSLQPEDDLFCPFPVNGGMVALVRSSTNGMTLFFTDGTPEQTTPLAFATSREAHRIDVLAAQDGKAWFNRIGGDGTYGIWETDGTLAGTRHVWGDATCPIYNDIEVTPGGSLYFCSMDTRTLHALPAGLQQPTLLTMTTRASIEPEELVSLGENVLVVANESVGGRELFTASADKDSFHLVREFMPGNAHGLTKPQFARFGDLVIFVAQTPEYGSEPWLSDGTPEGTRLLADVNPGAGSSNPNRFKESGGRVYFSAQTQAHGRELWVSDGTATGTQLVADLAPGIDSGEPHDFVPFKAGLLFSASDPQHGEEPWFSDGTSGGTGVIRDCIPGVVGSEPFKGVLINDHVWFSAVAPGGMRTLWQSDGTAAGTHPVFERLNGEPATPPEPAAWAQFQNMVVSTTPTPDLGAEPWITGAGNGESRLLRDIHPGPQGSNPTDFFEFRGELYFFADDGIHGRELWRSDGTEAGTTLAYDALQGKGSGDPHGLVVNHDKSFAFIARGDGFTTVHVYSPTQRDFYTLGPPKHHDGPWFVCDLRVGSEGQYEFSVQTPSGETTFWQGIDREPSRIPGLGRAQGK